MKGIRQLAQHLDISIGTVSRALNKSPTSTRRRASVCLRRRSSLATCPTSRAAACARARRIRSALCWSPVRPRAMEGDSYFPRVISRLQQVLEAHQLDLVLLPSQNAPDYLRAWSPADLSTP